MSIKESNSGFDTPFNESGESTPAPQSRRNASADEPNAVESSAVVQAIFVKQYEAYHARLLSLQVTNRLMCLAIIGFIVFSQRVSGPLALGLMSVSWLITWVWFYERARFTSNVIHLEEILARRSNDFWENTYIESRYDKPHFAIRFGRELSRAEPILWFLATAAIVAMVPR